jgi:hypothetical protein
MTPLRRALLAALSFLMGCAHVIHDAREPGVERPVATCTSSEPAQIPEVVRGEKGGLLFVQFTVEANGAVTDVQPGEFDPEPDPLLFKAVRDYVSQCKWKPGTQAGKPVAVHLSKGFGFYAPYLIDHAAPEPIDWSEALSTKLGAPKILHCLPDDPRIWDSLNDERITVVVQRDGHAGDTRLVGEPSGQSLADYALAALWLRSCRFEPAMTRDREPVATRVPLPLLFHDAPDQRPLDSRAPLADGATIPIPQPTSDCDSHPWSIGSDSAQAAFANGAAGGSVVGFVPVEVDYLVDTQGIASNITLRSRSEAARPLFHVVRRYLLGCHFMAVHDEGGNALEVQVHRIFQLRSDFRRISLNGPREHIIEGLAP